MQTAGIVEGLQGDMAIIRLPAGVTVKIKELCAREVSLLVDDGRTITTRQRNKIFALIRDITDYTCGLDPHRKTERETLRQLQLLYLIDRTDSEQVRRQLTHHYCQLLGADLFSLSEVDMTTAGDFIDYLVELCVEYGIPCMDTLLERCEDIDRYLYACVLNRRCAICGDKADIHEWDTVGMGRNRRTIHHLGQRVQPLCRRHHAEVGSIGQHTFDEKYHLTCIALDEKLCERLGWKK